MLLLSLSAGYVLASCGSDPLPFSTSAASTSGTGGGAGTGGAANTGGSGGTEATGCEGCRGVCVDGDHCAPTCPDGRDACGTGPDAAGACCADGDQCCEASVFGYAGGDVCRPKGEACPIACPGGEAACGIHQFCEIDPQIEGYGCKDDCAVGQLCDTNLCCPLGSSCTEVGSCPQPDLTIDTGMLSDSVDVVVRYFAPDACEIVEGCVAEPGMRTLMRFSLKTPNIGPGDLALGDPTGSPLFHYSDCHEHYHFDGYADYRLYNASNVEVGKGHKQAFCLLDFERQDPNAPDARYSCGFQGIQNGWADIYSRELPCQWVDVTDVAPGDYTLKVSVNKDRTIAEQSYDNNEAEVAVHVPLNTCVNGCETDDPACCAPGDPCGWGGNGSCDCGDYFGWDVFDCSGCLDDSPACDQTNSCPGACTPNEGDCCADGDACGLAHNGACDCGGAFAWDEADCGHCLSLDPDCPLNTCINGCTPYDAGNPCCGPDNNCSWDHDGWCDCGGAAWDAADCASCISDNPACPE